MKLVLRPIELADKVAFDDMMAEWRQEGGRINPGILRKPYEDFGHFVEQFNAGGLGDFAVPNRSYLCFDEDRNRLVGAVHLRYELDEDLIFTGGHLADGVRPSERGKGIATKMIALALEKYRLRDVSRILITCHLDNVASARTIQKNGGVLENEVTKDDGTVVQRYWIAL